MWNMTPLSGSEGVSQKQEAIHSIVAVPLSYKQTFLKQSDE